MATQNLSTLFPPSARAGANSDITSLSGLTTPLSVAQGGTGSTTGAAAGSPTAYNTQALPYTAAAADKGTVINPTGTGALNLPAATAVAGWFVWIKKRDEGGTATITPASGTIDGLASIRAYKEEFLVYYDAAASTTAGAPVYRTQGRQRGWIDFGSFSVTSGTASVTTTAGVGDAEIRDIQLNATNVVPSASAVLNLNIQQGGSNSTSSGESLIGSGTTSSATSNTSLPYVLTSTTGTTSPTSFVLEARNIQSVAASGICLDVKSYFAGTNKIGGINLTTTGALSQLMFTLSASATFTSMLYNVRLYRP